MLIELEHKKRINLCFLFCFFLKIAEWLSDSKMPAVCLKIDEDQRPVKLRKIVLGFPCSDNQTEFKFDLTLNYKIASIIQTYSEQKPALVVQQLFFIEFEIISFLKVLIQKNIFYL